MFCCCECFVVVHVSCECFVVVSVLLLSMSVSPCSGFALCYQSALHSVTTAMCQETLGGGGGGAWLGMGVKDSANW